VSSREIRGSRKRKLGCGAQGYGQRDWAVHIPNVELSGWSFEFENCELEPTTQAFVDRYLERHNTLCTYLWTLDPPKQIEDKANINLCFLCSLLFNPFPIHVLRDEGLLALFITGFGKFL
jgi:hypothetical protein